MLTGEPNSGFSPGLNDSYLSSPFFLVSKLCDSWGVPDEVCYGRLICKL